MTLQMPEDHNPTVYGAVMRPPTNGMLNIIFPMVSQDEGPDEEKKEDDKQPKDEEKEEADEGENEGDNDDEEEKEADEDEGS